MSADGEGSERAQEFQNLDPPQERPRRSRCSDLPLRFCTLLMASIPEIRRHSGRPIGPLKNRFTPRLVKFGEASEGIFAIVAGLFAPLIGSGSYTVPVLP